VGVREVPPFLFESMRVLTAGLVLCGWMVARDERPPERRRTVFRGGTARAIGHCRADIEKRIEKKIGVLPNRPALL